MKINRSTLHFSIQKPIVGLLIAICLILMNGGYSYTQTTVAFTIQDGADIVENETAPLTINNPPTGISSEATAISNVAVTDDALLACGPTNQAFPGILSSKVIGDPTEGLVSSATMHFGSSASGARRGRVQFLYTAAELNAAGFIGGGKISSLSFMYTFASNPANTVTNLTMKMGCTGLSSLGDGLPTETVPEDRWDFETGLTQVGSYASVAPPAAFMFPPTFAWVEFPINEPGMDGFLWDGVSNILVEFCSPDLQSDKPFFLSSSTTANNQALYLYDFASGDPDGCSYTAGKKSAIRPIVRMDVRSSFPSVNLSVSANSGTEAAGTAITVTATADAAVTGDQTIDLGVSGTGITGTDYSLSAATITILDGQTTGTATFTIQDDGAIEGAETATLTISNPSAGITLGATKTRNVSITDNDTAGYTYAHSGGNTIVSETGTTDAFTIVLSAQPASDVVIDVSSGDTGEATVSPASLTFTAANWNTPQTVTVTGVDDAILDGTRNTGITLSINDAASNDAFDPLSNQTVIVSTTDDELPEVSLSVSATFGTEAAGTVITVTATATGAVIGDQTVDIAASGTGITGTDYTLSAATITILDGATTGTVTFTVLDDAAIEGAETATLTISNPSAGVVLGATKTRNVSITDNDTAGYSYAHSGGNTTVSETGTTDAFTVVLSAQPASDVVIDVSSGDTGEATVSPASLTFTSANWNTPQTITVTGVDDAILDGTRNTGITLSINDAASNDAFDPLSNQTVIVSTTDDELPEVNLSVSATFGTEAAGTVITVTATATGAVIGDQTVDIAASGTGITGTDYTLSAGTITILDGATTGTATFTIQDDAGIEGAETATLTISNPSAGLTLGATTSRNISITDNDTAGYSYAHSGGNTTVSETGTTDGFTIVLSAQPASDVVIEVSSGDTGEATVSPVSLTFTSANWNTPQTVTVTGVDDALLDGTRNTGITLSVNDGASDDAFDPLSNQTVIVSTTDDELPEVTLSVSATFGTEAAGTVITVTATATGAVTGDQTIDLGVSGTGITGTDYTLSAGTITILDGQTTGTATFTILDDTAIEGAETATLMISNPSAGITLGATTARNISITDNDTAGYSYAHSGGNTTVSETGTTDGFTIVLSAQPASDVVIDVSSGDTGEATVSPASLTFTAANWNTPQTVMVTGVDDALLDGTRNTGITLSINDAASNDAFDPLSNQTVIVSTTDDELPEVNLSVSVAFGTEAAGTVITVTATATGAVTGDQTVDIAASGTGITGTDYTLSAGTITILDGATTGAATFTILDDAAIEGAETATLTISNPSAGIILGTTTARNVSITDNDTAGYSYAHSGGNTIVSETGTTDGFTIVLSAQPASDVVIDVSSGDTGEVTVSPTSLTFTSANWNTPQTVTVTGVDDALLDGTRNTGITLSINDAASNDAFDPLSNQTVIVSTTDDELPEVNLSVSVAFGTEAAGTVITVTATATGAVTGDQTVDIAASGTGITGTDYTLSAGTITILDGATTGAATFTILDDAAIEGAETATLTISNPSAGIILGTTTARNVSITDNDTAGYSYAHSGGNTIVSETGTTDGFTIVLSAQPASDVVIDVSSGDTGEVTVSPTSLTFTSANWNTPQTVTVTGVDDALLDGTRNTGITLSVNDAASDDAFDPLSNQTVIVSTLDDELPEVTLSVSATFGTEAAGTVITVTATATGAVIGDQTVDIAASGTGITGTDYTLSTGTITILDGQTTGTATFTIQDDGAIEGAETATLTISNPSAGITLGTTTARNVSITDNDIAGYTYAHSGGNTIVSETGTTDAFTVVLSAQPASDVVIEVSSGDTGEATVSPASLTFTAANWNTPQTITVTGVDDALLDGTRNTGITLSINDAASDDAFDPLSNQTVIVSTLDDELPEVSLSVSAAFGTEAAGTVITVTATATGAVTGDQTVDITASGTGITGTDYTLSAGSITILDGLTTGTATFTILDDAAIEGAETATLTISNPSAGLTLGATTSRNISITDNDTADVTLSVSTNTASETDGTVVTITATSSVAVTGDQTVDIAASGAGITGTDYSLSAAAITILNGTTTGTATFTILDDADIEGTETATLTISNPSSGLSLGVTTTQNITITDNEIPTVNLTINSASVGEAGNVVVLTVTADVAVVGDQTVDVAVTGAGVTGTDYAINSATITILNGQTSGVSNVTLQDDSYVEGTETATFTISNPSAGIVLGTTTSQNLDILDDDVAGLTIIESDGNTTVSETGTTDEFTVRLSSRPTSDVIIDISSGDTGEATISPSSLTFTQFNWNLTQTVTITGVSDAVFDGDQNTTITLSVNDASSNDFFDPMADQTVTVTTTEAPPAVNLSVSSNTGTEEDGTIITVIATAARAVVGDQIVDIAASGTRITGTDYILSAGSINILNGETTGSVTFTIQDDALGEGNETATLTITNPSGGILLGTTTSQDVMITDNDPIEVNLSANANSGSEIGTVITLQVTAAFAVVGDQTVDLSVSGTDITFTDYALINPTITILDGQTSNTISFTIQDDTYVEDTETATITMGNPSAGLALGAIATLDITIIDNDVAGFNITESDGNTSVSETGTTDDFLVKLDRRPTSDVVIDISSGDLGEATVSPTQLTFTINTWNTAQTVTVTGVDDNFVDGDQNTTITLSINDANSNDLFDPVADQTLTVTTIDDDAVGFTVAQSDGNTAVSETGTTDEFTVVLSAQPASDVIIDISSGDTGEATVSHASLTFTAANWNAPQTIIVTGVDDALVDGNQNTTVTLSINDAGSDDSFDLLADQTIMVTTVDDDTPGFTIVESDGSTEVSETGTIDNFTVVLNSQPTSDVLIDVSSGDLGEATVSPTSLTFTTANWNTPQTIIVTGIDDALVDGNQTTNITLSINDGSSDDLYDPLADQVVSVITTDNDFPEVNLSVSANTGSEASGTVITVTATASAAVTGDQIVDLAVSGTGITGTDYSLSAATITILNGATTGTVTFTILDDVDVEGTETATLTISNPSAGITLGATTTQDITITDNDVVANPTVELSVSANAGTEAAGTVITVTATASAAVTGDQTVDIAVSGTGITGTDYSLSPATITILNGVITGTATFTILDDVDVEGTETATLTISNPSAGITLGATTMQDITITDNDVVANPTVELSVSANTGTEAAGTVITVTATASAAVTGDQTVDIAVSGTGITGTDYSLSPATITILNGVITGTATFTILDDVDVEGTETATLTISNPSAGITLGATTMQDITITDNDVVANPTVELSVSANTGSEASGTVITVTATASAAVTGDQIVDLAVSGTGITGTDYSLSAATITILNGATTGTVTFTILDDVDVEGTETATLTISNPSAGITLGATTTQGITITDNDVAANPTVELSVSANAGTEAAGTVITVTATASAAVTGDQTVDIAVSGTGITGTDYSLSATTITILNGTTTGTATFTIVDDTDIEGTETATLTISNPSAGITLGATATQNITITDNDVAANPTVELSVSANAGTEAAGTVITVTATASATVTGDQTVDLTVSGTGITGTDYSLSAATITILNGATTGTATFTILDDADVEGTETATLTISNPSARITLSATTTQGITITDNDVAPNPTVELSVSANAGTEAAGTVITVTATASAAVTGDQTIDLSVSGTGITGTDYSLSATTITILNGTTTGTATFTIVDDTYIEGTETATLIISNPSAGITLGATTTKNVVITDNDFPEVSLSVSTNNGSEKEGTMIIVTATASSEVVGGKTVDLGISGAGITSTDYAISSTILSISNGETSGTAVIMITDDSDIEGIETMTLTISNPSEGIVLGTNITQDIVIEDDDYARPDPANSNTTITASPSILVADGVSTSIITVILSNANGDPLLISGGTVTLTTTGSASLSAVVDNTDGTYTATLTNTVAEDVTITGQVNGEDITNNALVIFTPDLTDSDGDGVIDSDEDTNGNGDLTDDDTDDDGIPNYLDPDDDGDGVPTKDEDVNKDGDPTNDDTDGDGVPNHLDEDDDGDGKSTEEEGTGDSDGDGTPDYLDTVDKVEASQILSPNGDGINDVFILKDIEKYPENMVSIFNRKGNLVFEIQGYNNNDKAWRGFPNTGFLTNGDRIVPNGTYFYVVDLKDGERPITGFFVLKR